MVGEGSVDEPEGAGEDRDVVDGEGVEELFDDDVQATSTVSAASAAAALLANEHCRLEEVVLEPPSPNMTAFMVFLLRLTCRLASSGANNRLDASRLAWYPRVSWRFRRARHGSLEVGRRRARAKAITSPCRLLHCARVCDASTRSRPAAVNP